MARGESLSIRFLRRAVAFLLLLTATASSGCQSSAGGSKWFSFNNTKRASVPEAPPGYKAGGPARGKSGSDPFLPTVKIPDGEATASTDAK